MAPRTPVEETVAGVWAAVLGLERVGIHDNFFDLGGHSLFVTQVMARIRDAFHAELPLRSLFETPRVAGLAATIVQKQIEQTDSAAVAQLLAELEQSAEDTDQTIPAETISLPQESRAK